VLLYLFIWRIVAGRTRPPPAAGVDDSAPAPARDSCRDARRRRSSAG
jgi:hypothetical protein